MIMFTTFIVGGMVIIAFGVFGWCKKESKQDSDSDDETVYDSEGDPIPKLINFSDL